MILFGILFFIGLLLGILRINLISAEILQRHISTERESLKTLLTIVIAILSLAIPFVLFAISELYKELPLVSYWVPMIVGNALALLGFGGIIKDYILFFKRRRHKTT
jgi:hypothetical protein